MVNPDDLVSALVAKYRAIDAVTSQLGDAGQIIGYADVSPNETNLRVTILQQPPGSIVVVWMGMAPARYNNSLYVRHRFSFYLRTAESPAGIATYGSLVAALINGIDPDTGQPMHSTTIHPSCESMDLDYPSAQRNSMLISPDGETLDYFEFQMALVEMFL